MENKLEIQLARLEQLVEDGFKDTEKSFKEMIAKQNYTNGNVKDNIKCINSINTEITKMKTVAYIFRGLGVLVLIPSIAYLLVSYLDNQQKMAIIEKELAYVDIRQLKIEESCKDINESIVKYLTE